MSSRTQPRLPLSRMLVRDLLLSDAARDSCAHQLLFFCGRGFNRDKNAFPSFLPIARLIRAKYSVFLVTRHLSLVTPLSYALSPSTSVAPFFTHHRPS